MSKTYYKGNKCISIFKELKVKCHYGNCREIKVRLVTQLDNSHVVILEIGVTESAYNRFCQWLPITDSAIIFSISIIFRSIIEDGLNLFVGEYSVENIFPFLLVTPVSFSCIVKMRNTRSYDSAQKRKLRIVQVCGR